MTALDRLHTAIDAALGDALGTMRERAGRVLTKTREERLAASPHPADARPML